MNFDGLKYIVAGVGFWGAVFAERLASVLNEKILIIDKRNHIGGNSYSEIDKKTVQPLIRKLTSLISHIFIKVFYGFSGLFDVNCPCRLMRSDKFL